MRRIKMSVYDGLPSSLSRSCDGIRAAEIETADEAAAAIAAGAELIFGNTFAAKETIKSAGYWFVKMVPGWAKPEIAKQIKRIEATAERMNLTPKFIY